MTVLLKLSMDRVPMSLLQTVSKMSFVKNKKTQMSDLILQRNHHVINYKLPNGNTISNEGLPEGLTDESLEKVDNICFFQIFPINFFQNRFRNALKLLLNTV